MSGLASNSAAAAKHSKSCAFAPTSGNRWKKGTIIDRISERQLTSQYQPLFPAFRKVPHDRVSRNRSSGARSVCETLKAAESFQASRVVATRTTHDHEA